MVDENMQAIWEILKGIGRDNARGDGRGVQALTLSWPGSTDRICYS